MRNAIGGKSSHPQHNDKERHDEIKTGTVV